MELKNYFAQDTQGNIIPAANCYLYTPGTSVPATGVVDKNGTALPSPFPSDDDGLIQFAAPNGEYDLRVASGSRDYRIRVQCMDVRDTLASATAEADRAQDAADEAEAQAALAVVRFLAPAASLPITRDDGTALQVGDRIFNTTTQTEYLYKTAGWLPNDFDPAYYSANEGAGRIGTSTGVTVEAQLLALQASLTTVLNKMKAVALSVNNLTELRAVDKTANTFAMTKGYYIPGDGGGAVYWYNPDDTITLDNGGSVIVAADGGRWYLLTDGNVSVRQFGAKGDGAADDTAPILAAYNFVNLVQLFYTLDFDSGRYVTNTQFLFVDFYFGIFRMKGAAFFGGGGLPAGRDAIFKVQNSANSGIDGSFHCSALPQSGSGGGGNPDGYGCGVFLLGKPGGVLNPELGIFAFFHMNGYQCERTHMGLRIGERNNDAQCSEILISNYGNPYCPGALWIGGSQTIVSLVNCNLASNPVAGLTNQQFKTIVMDGGIIHMSGGNLELHSTDASQCVEIRPCESATYGNNYGRLNLTNVLIETSSRFAVITNPNGLANPKGFQGGITMSNCGGYMGSIPIDQAIITVFDTNFDGVISIPDGNRFYRQTTNAARTAGNVDASSAPNALISVGKTVFDTGTGFQGWPYGIKGGKLMHDDILAVEAFAQGQVIAANTNTVVVWNNRPVDNVRRGRYDSMVNTANGDITIPNGARSVRIEVQIVLAEGAQGNIWLTNDSTGEHLGYGVIGGGIASLVRTISTPVAGHIYRVRLQITAGVTLTSAKQNNLCCHVAT